MVWLTLNEWEVPITSAERSPVVEVGASGRSFAGTARKSNRATKRAWRCTTAPMNEDDADTLENLLVGSGWRVPFDTSLYADDTGLGPETGYTATIAATTPTPLLGAKRCKLPMGYGTKLQYDVGFGTTFTGYTISCWLMVSSGGSWAHYLWRVSADGVTTTKKKNNGTVSNIYTITIASGAVQFSGADPDDNSNTDDIFLDELIMLPLACSDDFATDALYQGGSGSVAAWPNTPELRAEGDFIRESSVTVLGKIESQACMQGKLDAAWSSSLRTPSFVLEEV